MREPILNINTKCYEVFNDLSKAIQHLPPQFEGQITSHLLTELFDRYRLWAGNVGIGHANHNYQLSLDYRLREASWLKSQVIELVSRLCNNLERIAQILREERIPFENRTITSKTSSASLSDSENHYEISDDLSWGSSPSEDAELDACRDELMSAFSIQESARPSNNDFDNQSHIMAGYEKEVPYLCNSAKLLIDHLYEIPIRKPAPMNRLIKHDNTSLFNKYVAPFDILYVRDLLKDVTLDAANRMGGMNTQRRRILEYRRRHYQSLQTDAVSTIALESFLENRVNPIEMQRPTIVSVKLGSELGKLSQTKATTFREPPRFSSSLNPPPSVANSQVSRASTYTAQDIPLHIPIQPVESSKGHGYVCPYCFILVHAMNEKSWEKHVFKDLQPYVCTFANCSLGEHFFSGEDEWYDHEARYHRCYWSCNIEGHGYHSLETDFLSHLRAEHDLDITSQQLSTMVEAFRKSSKVLAGLCHLCGSKTTNLKKHVARHLKRIACFILPRPEVELDSDFDEETSNKAVDFGAISSEKGSLILSKKTNGLDVSSNEHIEENKMDNDSLLSPIHDENESSEGMSYILEDPLIPDATDRWEECIMKFSMARSNEGELSPLKPRIHESDSSPATISTFGHQTEKVSLNLPNKRLKYEDYTVAWVTSFLEELEASRLMLDEHHDDLPYDVDDITRYYLGSISGHNVVIAFHARVPALDSVALAMQRVFPNCLNTPLFVGLGGGVPSLRHDIRLGDVVVGVPTAKCPAIVQFDLDTYPPFDTKGTFMPPAALLLNAVNSVATKEGQLADRILSELTSIKPELPSWQYTYPGAEFDVLYAPECEHYMTDSICERCGPRQQIRRQSRANVAPVVHYGGVAGVVQRIKHGNLRDQLAENHDILCFGMGAIGLTSSFPFLMIHGISHYCDSRDYRSFRRYASLNVASYAKIILSSISVQQSVSSLELLAQDANEKLEHREHLMAALNFEVAERRQDVIEEAHTETCEWILKTLEFRTWLTRSNSYDGPGLLWIRGEAGCGKSTIMKFVSNRLQSPDQLIVVSYYFTTLGSSQERSSLELWRSLVFQILSQAKDLQVVLDTLEKDTEFDMASPKIVLGLLLEIVLRLKHKRLVCFVDALDECMKNESRGIVADLESLSHHARIAGTKVNICASSRPWPLDPIVSGISIDLDKQEGHMQDISRFVDDNLQLGLPNELEELKQHILGKSNGIFLWVVIVIRICKIRHAYMDNNRVIIPLSLLPEGLHQLYFAMITSTHALGDQLMLSLQWMLYAQRPLKLDELYFGTLYGTEGGAVRAQRLALEFDVCDIRDGSDKRKQFISLCSRGLIDSRRSPFIQFIHHSVRDFLHQFDRSTENLWENLARGTGHQQLRICCARQLTTRGLMQYIADTAEKSSRTNIAEATKKQDELELKYPLLNYAANNVLYHAEQAQAAGVSQYDFLQSFEWSSWKTVYNFVQTLPDRQVKQADGVENRVTYILEALNLPHLQSIWKLHLKDKLINSSRMAEK